MSWEIRQGDALERLREMPDRSVQMCITSPPYYGLRDYGTAVWEGGDEGCEHRGRDARTTGGTGASSKKQNSNFGSTVYSGDCICGARRVDRQIGLEQTPEEYVARLVDVFREVRRVLRPEGVLLLNLGDSYAANRSYQVDGGKQTKGSQPAPWNHAPAGLKPKDLIGIPWMAAFALRANGWYLRIAMPWIKRNPMPESSTDRPGTSHEYWFLLTKQPKYFWDSEAVKVASVCQRMRGPAAHPDTVSTNGNGGLSRRQPGPTRSFRTADPFFASIDAEIVAQRQYLEELEAIRAGGQGLLQDADGEPLALVVNPAGFKEAHFATFPQKLVEPLIKAGSKEGDTVLDPFNGAATTGLVALNLGRKYLGIELNPEYIEISRKRLDRIDAYQPGLFAEVAG